MKTSSAFIIVALCCGVVLGGDIGRKRLDDEESWAHGACLAMCRYKDGEESGFASKMTPDKKKKKKNDKFVCTCVNYSGAQTSQNTKVRKELEKQQQLHLQLIGLQSKKHRNPEKKDLDNEINKMLRKLKRN